MPNEGLYLGEPLSIRAMTAWMDYAKGLAYLLIGYALEWVSKIIPGIVVVGPWLTTFFGIAGIAAVVAGAVKIFETFLGQFELKGIYADVGKILIASGVLYAYPPIKALGAIPFAAIVFAFLLGSLIKK